MPLPCHCSATAVPCPCYHHVIAMLVGSSSVMRSLCCCRAAAMVLPCLQSSIAMLLNLAMRLLCYDMTTMTTCSRMGPCRHHRHALNSGALLSPRHAADILPYDIRLAHPMLLLLALAPIGSRSVARSLHWAPPSPPSLCPAVSQGGLRPCSSSGWRTTRCMRSALSMAWARIV